MSDQRLRELERRWKAGGGLEAEVALLQERLRVGDLELGLLGLAAHLGHRAARGALGGLAPDEASRAGWPSEWDEQAQRLLHTRYDQPRIWFPGNPWPAGHGLTELTWTGRLDVEAGLLFDLHLKTAPYYADDRDDDDSDLDDDQGDWQAKIVWGNYHACTLSSTNWHEGGFRVGSEAAPFDLDALGAAAYRVDELPPPDRDDQAFHVYLLGHDSAADHRILFTPLGGGAHRLEWSGRLAQTYVGDDEFRYRFFCRAPRVTFNGFEIPTGLRPQAARAALARFVVDPTRYRIRKGHFVPT